MANKEEGRREIGDPTAADTSYAAKRDMPYPYSTAKRWRGQGVCLPKPTASFEQEMEYYHRDLAHMNQRQLYREFCWITYCLAQPLTPPQEEWFFERLARYQEERRRRDADAGKH
jgi:hypothetical protein